MTAASTTKPRPPVDRYHAGRRLELTADILAAIAFGAFIVTGFFTLGVTESPRNDASMGALPFLALAALVGLPSLIFRCVAWSRRLAHEGRGAVTVIAGYAAVTLGVLGTFAVASASYGSVPPGLDDVLLRASLVGLLLVEGARYLIAARRGDDRVPAAVAWIGVVSVVLLLAATAGWVGRLDVPIGVSRAAFYGGLIGLFVATVAPRRWS